MLYVFCGDRYGAREHARAFADACRKKREKAEYIYFSPSVTGQSLEELLFGQGLFENKYIVFCDEVLADTASEHLMKHVRLYHEAPHMFIIFEPSLDKKQEKAFKKHNVSVKRCEEAVEKEDIRDIFGFTDVFMRRDTVRTFASLHRLLSLGKQPASILNILLWQLRILALVSGSGSAAEAGVKPFVYTKTKKALSGFSDPFDTFAQAEEIIRHGRLRGEREEEILEYLVLRLG